MVTPRLSPLTVQGSTLHQVFLPIHFGYEGEITGSSENELLPIVSDPNVSMHEGKAFVCQVTKGRLEHRSDVPTAPMHRRPRAEPLRAAGRARSGLRAGTGTGTGPASRPTR